MNRKAQWLSDHFDGRVFHNHVATPHGAAGFLRWSMERRPEPWAAPIVSTPALLPLANGSIGRSTVTFVNHATVLIQVDGLTILTDPIWSDRCSPVPFAGPRRYRSAGIAFESLPKIDLVLISHDHYDHLDAPTIRRLARHPDTRFVTGLGNGPLLRKLGARRVHELDWWQDVSAEVTGGVRITFVPAQHFSGRGPLANRTLWGGFVVSSTAGNIYFAGDTGYGPHFSAIRSRLGDVEFAMLPIGAYAPRWYMAPVHMDPTDAVRAHQKLGAAISMGIHFGTFRLTDEGQDEPALDLASALAEAGVSAEHFFVPEHGETRSWRPTVRAVQAHSSII